MHAQLQHERFAPVLTATQRLSGITPTDEMSASFATAGFHGDIEARMKGLQEWICELLITNLQLRVALTAEAARIATAE